MLHTLLAQSTNTANDQINAAASKGVDFDKFNPLVIDGSTKNFSTPGSFITEALKFAFPAAGIILFVMILWGGFEMIAGATSAKGKDAGRQRITAAVIGFMLLFVSYWLMRLLGFVFGVTTL